MLISEFNDGVLNKRERGFSLIEMVVVLIIMGILLAKGIPEFSLMLNNMKVRAWSESVMTGIQLARNEAIKQNRKVYFQLVTDLSNSCAPVASTSPKNAWIVSTYSDITDSSAVALTCEEPATVATSSGASNVVQKTYNDAPDMSSAAYSGTQNRICFDSVGRQCETDQKVIAFSSPAPSRSCVSAGGGIRCLEIRVSVSGNVRMCDPAVASASDPRKC